MKNNNFADFYAKREDVEEFIKSEVINTTEAIEILGISRVRIGQLINEGKIKCIKRTKTDTLFFRKDVEERAQEAKRLKGKFSPKNS